ncbi:MAG: hypothetical protein R2940_07360 [Syntrophotaleaceae bacterium]
MLRGTGYFLEVQKVACPLSPFPVPFPPGKHIDEKKLKSLKYSPYKVIKGRHSGQGAFAVCITQLGKGCSMLSLVRLCLLMLTLSLVNAGCSVIPVPIAPFTKRPYPQDVLENVGKKGTDKKLVLKILGNPKAVRSAGKYWFYASNRDMLGFIGSDVVLQDFEWLAVHFDDLGQVDFLEKKESVDGCLSNGICNYSGLIYSNPSLAVLSAPKIEDEKSKFYKVSDRECAIYIYMEPVWGGCRDVLALLH